MWVASRPGACGLWSQAGQSLELKRIGRWFAAVPREQWPDDPETVAWVDANWDPAVGDCRVEIVVIGVGVDRAKLEVTFDAALLTEAEFAAGPEAWVRMGDPLPPWPDPAAGVDEAAEAD